MERQHFPRFIQRELNERTYITAFPRVIMIPIESSADAKDVWIPLMTQRDCVARHASYRKGGRRTDQVRESVPYPPCGEPQSIQQRGSMAPEGLPFHDCDRPQYGYAEENEAVLY